MYAHVVNIFNRALAAYNCDLCDQ